MGPGPSRQSPTPSFPRPCRSPAQSALWPRPELRPTKPAPPSTLRQCPSAPRASPSTALTLRAPSIILAPLSRQAPSRCQACQPRPAQPLSPLTLLSPRSLSAPACPLTRIGARQQPARSSSPCAAPVATPVPSPALASPVPCARCTVHRGRTYKRCTRALFSPLRPTLLLPLAFPHRPTEPSPIPAAPSLVLLQSRQRAPPVGQRPPRAAWGSIFISFAPPRPVFVPSRAPDRSRAPQPGHLPPFRREARRVYPLTAGVMKPSGDRACSPEVPLSSLYPFPSRPRPSGHSLAAGERHRAGELSSPISLPLSPSVQPT